MNAGAVVIDGTNLKHAIHSNQENAVRKTLSWLNQDGYLKKSGILDWIHQLLDKEFSKLQKINIWSHNGSNPPGNKYSLILDDINYTITRQRNGPAHTFIVEFKDFGFPGAKSSFTMDVVPAIRIDVDPEQDLWPSDFEIDDNYCQIKWHAIPKPDHTLSKENDCEWSTSFADLERIFIDDRYQLKYVIRLFKVKVTITMLFKTAYICLSTENSRHPQFEQFKKLLHQEPFLVESQRVQTILLDAKHGNDFL